MHSQDKVVKNLSEPKLLTSLKIIESFHTLVEKDIKGNAQVSQGETTLKKLTQRVNIPFDEKIYKGLIDLKVNDADLGIDFNVPLKPKEIAKVKEPEPNLSDYYTPTFNREYVIKPKVTAFDITKFKMPPVPSVLEVSKHWEPEEFF